MSEAAALLAAIRQAPDDDAPRLVYADWLDEHGQPERAEFIRVQIQLARNDSATLRKREAELLAEHHDAFAEEFSASHLRFRFERGFIAGFGHTGVFAGHHGTMMVLFRFYPDGFVICTTGCEPEEVIESFHRRNKYLLRGNYRLESLELPAMIRFHCESSKHGDLVFSGTFEPNWLNPDGNCRTSGYPMLRRFAHYHIDGFDSFSESP